MANGIGNRLICPYHLLHLQVFLLLLLVIRSCILYPPNWTSIWTVPAFFILLPSMVVMTCGTHSSVTGPIHGASYNILIYINVPVDPASSSSLPYISWINHLAYILAMALWYTSIINSNHTFCHCAAYINRMLYYHRLVLKPIHKWVNPPTVLLH